MVTRIKTKEDDIDMLSCTSDGFLSGFVLQNIYVYFRLFLVHHPQLLVRVILSVVVGSLFRFSNHSPSSNLFLFQWSALIVCKAITYCSDHIICS